MPYSSSRGLSPWCLVALAARALMRVIKVRASREIETHTTILAAAEAACLAAATAGRARNPRASGGLMTLVHSAPTPEAPASLVASAVRLASACLVAREGGDHSLVHAEVVASLKHSREALAGDQRAQLDADRLLLEEIDLVREIAPCTADGEPFDPDGLGPPWPNSRGESKRRAPSARGRGDPNGESRGKSA